MATLRDAYTAGRLTLEEFDDRTTTAYASKTWGELRKLTEDLPAQPVLGADVPGRRLPASLGSKPEQGRESLPPAQRRRPVAFFPIIALWLVLALATRNGHDIIAPTVVLVMALAFTSFARHR